MPMSRTSFIWGMVGDQRGLGYFWRSLLVLILFSICGSCVALWKVRCRSHGQPVRLGRC